MRALCTVRGPLGDSGAGAAAARGGGAALAAGARLLALRAPGLTHPLHFVVEVKSRVRELRTHAHTHLGILGTDEAELFGLAILTADGEYLFIDLDSKLSKYAPKSWKSSHTHGLDGNGRPLLELYLAVQFYVEDAARALRSDVARRLYFLQLRANALSRADAAPPRADADADEQRAFLRHPHRLDSHHYAMKRTKSEPEPGLATLCVTPRGVSVAEKETPPVAFAWSDIAKLSFDRKRFEIRTVRDRVILYSPTEDKSKYLFALCRDTHQFSMKLASEPSEASDGEQRVSVASSGSSNTTSGVVSDRAHSEDELEIMIDCPPALSTESLALAHLLDGEASGPRGADVALTGERDADYGPFTLAASSETSGVYTMGGSESTATADTASRASIYLLPRAEDATADLATDCVDGGEPFRSGSAASFHGDGSDPTDTSRALLSASELSDLIVGRGAYPTRRSVSDTLDSVSDYVRLPPPRIGDSYVRGHEDTAPAESEYGEFERPPTPPARSHSDPTTAPPRDCASRRSPPPYREPQSRPPTREEVPARLVTTKPMITILKAEAGDVSAPISRNFAGPVSAQPERLVAMMRPPPPPPPPPRRTRQPPPPPPHLKQFHQQMCSDVDYVVYPMQDPRVSQRNYLESKLLGANGFRYRSTPFLSSAPSGGSLALSRSGSADLLSEEPAPRCRSRAPPPPPPPHSHRHVAKKEPTIDIKTLREKSKNLDLPLIAALCNDRSLLKQTKAFGPGEGGATLGKRAPVRNPNDKLPELPHTRAQHNTYVAHPGSAGTLPPRL